VRLASTCALIAAATSVARADIRDTFGLAKPGTDKPIECADGLDFGCATATDPMADEVPYAITTWLPATYLLTLPTGNQTHDQVASYVTGVGRDDVGVSIAGGNGLENRWTIDGAPADNIRTGGAETRLPLTFLDGMMIQTGGFAARDRTSTGGVIDARLKTAGDKLDVDVRAWGSWAADARHTPEIANTYQVKTGTIDPGPSATASIVASGPLPKLFPNAKSWFVAGIAPTVTASKLNLSASSLSDYNDDGIPDGLPGIATLSPIESSHQDIGEYSVPAMLRVGVDGPVQHFTLTAIGELSSANSYMFDATPQAGSVDITHYVGDVIATYHADTRDWKVHLQAAWHRSLQRESATDPAAQNIPQDLTAYVPATLGDDPALAAKCADNVAGDPFPMITNCPVPSGWFSSGGAGELQNITADRLTFTADVARRLGNHALRLGATVEDSQMITDSFFTGGQEELSLFPGENDVRRFVSQSAVCSTDIEVACPYVDTSELAYRTLYGAAYAEDTWQPAPNLRVDGGVRWELMWVGTPLHFSNEWAPRLGLSYDFLGGGRSRAWVSMGRSFAMLPAGLGSAVLVGNRYADELAFNGTTTRSVFTGAPQSVIDDTQPITQDELTAGVEVALNRIVRARAYIQGRWLYNGIDSTADGFGNPGAFGDQDDATRSTRLFALELSTALDAWTDLRVGWGWGETTGNWTGAYNPVEGTVLFNGADFDVFSTNQQGPLPTTPGQRVYFEGTRHAKLGSVTLMASARLTVQSGMPLDVMANGPDGLVYLLPRGAAGYGPMQTQANLRLGASWRRFDVTLDFFNIFDRRAVTNQDTIYSQDDIHPIVGGAYEDLVWLKTDDGIPAVRTNTYATATEYQAPFMAVLGIHRAF
jgi:hypothetical protein